MANESVLINIKIEGTENEAKINAFSASIIKLQEENKKLVETNKQLAKAEGDNSAEIAKNTSQIELNKQKISEGTSSRKGLIQTIVAEDESIKSLSIKNAELIKQRNLISTATEDGRKKIAALNTQIDTNNAKIKENSSVLEKQRLNIGNYAGGFKDAFESVKGIVPALGSFSTAQKGVNTALNANPIGAVILGLTALKELFGGNAEIADTLSFALDGITKAFGFVIDTVVTTVTSFDKLKEAFLNPIQFITNLAKGTANAAVEGYNAAKAIDAFTVASAESAQQIALADIKIKSLEKSLKDRTKSEQERIKIANELADLEIENSRRRETLAKQELANEELRLKGKVKSGDEEAKLINLQTAVLVAAEETRVTEAQRRTRINILLDKQEKESAKENAEEKKKYLKEVSEAEDKALIQREENFRKEQERVKQEVLGYEARQKAAQDLANQIVSNIELPEKEADQLTESTKKSIDQGRLRVRWEQASSEQRLQVLNNYSAQAASIFRKDTAGYKALNSARAAMDAYAGAARALKDFPAPLSYVFAAISIASGLAQVASINAIKFAKGGIATVGGVLNGPSHANGGIPFAVGGRVGFEAEGGEAIINKRSTAMFKPLLSQINQAGGGVAFANGGMISNEIRQATQSTVQTVLVLQDFELAQYAKNQTIAQARVI